MTTAFLSAGILFLPFLFWAIILLGKEKRIAWPIMILSIITYAIWRYQSPYPSPLNWDMWEHQTVVNAIKNGQFALLPSFLSDTFRFNGYTTAFHFIVAGAQQALHPDILGFWWFADYFLLFTSALATAALVYTLTNQSIIALFAAIASLFFFESSVVYASLLFMPQTYAALVFALFLATLLKRQSVTSSIGLIFLSACILLPLHFIIGSAAVAILIAITFTKYLKLYNPWMYGVLLLLIPAVMYTALGMINSVFHLASINYGEAASYTQTIQQKLATMQSWYSFIPLLLLPLGIIESFIDEKYRHITLLAALVSGVVLAQFPYALKFYAVGRYLIIAVMAIGAITVISIQRSRMFTLLTLLVFTIVFGCIFYTNAFSWKNSLLSHGVVSYISSDEVRAAAWVQDHYTSKQAYIISDPATQGIMESMSGINSQGGVYMNEESRNAIIEALSTHSPELFSQSLNTIHDQLSVTPVSKLLIVSARSIRWLQMDDSKRLSVAENIWKPEVFSLNDMVFIEHMAQQFSLKPVYSNASIALFELHI